MSGAERGARDRVGRFVTDQVARERTPGASWWVGREGRVVAQGAAGCTSLEVGSPAIGETTPFDLASLTKPLVTATLLVLLEQEGTLDLEAPLATVLGELRGSSLGARSLLSLANHTAGLPAWAPLCVRGGGLPGFLDRIAGLPAEGPPGRTLYSDLGYIVLGAVVERATGEGLAPLFAERIARPLGLARTGFAVAGRLYRDAAATEVGNTYERALAGEAGRTFPWRERIPPGEVHDANAHALGGVAGHAGLFGTAAEVGRLASALLAGGALPLDDRARARILCVAPPSDGRTVGLVVASRSGAARGILPDRAPGHTGFTGTSLWLDPDTRSCFVLLTNRVHPRVSPVDFQPLRRAFHRLARVV